MKNESHKVHVNPLGTSVFDFISFSLLANRMVFGVITNYIDDVNAMHLTYLHNIIYECVKGSQNIKVSSAIYSSYPYFISHIFTCSSIYNVF